MTATVDSTTLIERTRALAPLIEAEADATEAARTMTAPVVEALKDAGLFWILVPRELGGLEADVTTSLEVFEELARADGSTGWSLMANATTSCFAAIYTSDAAVEAMFPPGAPAIHAGMLGPAGTATVDEREVVVTGDYRFGSGCGHADWFGAGAMEMRDGEPAMMASGMPAMWVVFVPRDHVELRDGWDVMGLTGTGSFDYGLDHEHVAREFAFPLLEAEATRGGATMRLGLLTLTAVGHAGFALGVARRALDEVLELGKGKQRLGGEPIAEQQLFLHDYALHDAAVRAARAFTYEAFAVAEAEAARDGAPTPVAAARTRQATTYATRVGADAARFAYTWAGSNGLRNPSVIGRCFRDLHAGTQHLFVDNNTLTGYTQTRLMFG